MGHRDCEIFSVRELSKSYGGVQALKSTTLRFMRNEVHAIVGENGAGKSTLMKIIGGVIQPDSGQMFYKGQEVRFSSPRDSINTGIALIHQELSMMPDLNIIENIFMGRMDSKFGIVRQEDLTSRTQDLLKTVGLDVDPHTLVRKLSLSQRQLVEIAKALSTNANLIMMDEPNSSLTDMESERLFAVIEDLKAKGISILYVSHKIAEVLRISDKVSVLRDGAYVGTLDRADATADRVIQMMIGREMDINKFSRPSQKRRVILRVKGLTGNGFRNISFDLHQGEILGFAGLVGAGRSEVARAIFGATRFSSGSITLDNELVLFDSPSKAIKHGMAMVQEDRKGLSLFMGLSVSENISISALPELSRSGIVNYSKVNEVVTTYKNRLNIKVKDLDEPVSSLSGGNQQKTVLSRWLSTDPRVLILDEPTHGIDIGAKHEIYKLITLLADRGIGILLISSELPEIISMSDRVVVMREGVITATLDKDEITDENIMRCAAYEP